jgi:hypothetical protein
MSPVSALLVGSWHTKTWQSHIWFLKSGRREFGAGEETMSLTDCRSRLTNIGQAMIDGSHGFTLPTSDDPRPNGGRRKATHLEWQ